MFCELGFCESIDDIRIEVALEIWVLVDVVTLDMLQITERFLRLLPIVIAGICNGIFEGLDRNRFVALWVLLGGA